MNMSVYAHSVRSEYYALDSVHCTVSAVYTRLCTLHTPHPTGTCAVISFTQLQPFVSIIKACVTIKHSECINVVILFKRTCNSFNHFTTTFVAVFPSNSRFAFINVKFIVLINFFRKTTWKSMKQSFILNVRIERGLAKFTCITSIVVFFSFLSKKWIYLWLTFMCICLLKVLLWQKTKNFASLYQKWAYIIFHCCSYHSFLFFLFAIIRSLVVSRDPFFCWSI